jgi:hypothetical protein
MSEANLSISHKEYFLLITKCLDLLCYWPHNCSIINIKIGKEIITSFNLIIKFSMEQFFNQNGNSNSMFMFELLIRMLSILSRLQEYQICEKILKLENGKAESEAVIMTYNFPWDDKKLNLYGFLISEVNTDDKEYESNLDIEKNGLLIIEKETTVKGNNNDSTISAKLLGLDTPQLLLYLLDGINNQIENVNVNESEQDDSIKPWLILRIHVLHTILTSLHTAEAIKFGNRYSIDCPGSFGIILKSYYQYSKPWVNDNRINHLLIVQFS